MKKEDCMKIYDEIVEKIGEVVQDVCKHPLVFVSEMDIHVLMMKALMEIGCLKRKYDTACTIGKMSKDAKPSPRKYKTMLVHKEYGNERGKKQRSDIVIFDKKDVESISDPLDLKRKGGYLEPEYVFEFGTEKSAGSNEAYKKHLEGDFGKLSRIKNTGFLIHIQRIYVKSRKKTKRYDDNRKKIKDYANSTEKIWEKYREKCNNKVNVLIFFVDLGGEKRVIKKKVRMFNPYPNSNSKSKKYHPCPYVNQEDIKEIIKKFLKENDELKRDIEEIKGKCRNKKRKRSKKK